MGSLTRSRATGVALAVLSAAGVATAAIFAAAASASQVVSAHLVTDLRLAVNGKGEALLTYRSQGKPTSVLAWDAVNALPPTQEGTQTAFQLDYSGGYDKYFNDDPDVKALLAQYAKIKGTPGYLANPVVRQVKEARAYAESYAQSAFVAGCGKYDGPALAWVVAACKAPDGSYWAVQEWQRTVPNGRPLAANDQATTEVHLAHWTGSLPALQVSTDTPRHLSGVFTYGGAPVYGFRATPAGQPLDSFGRNVYIDGSRAGAGWARENSFLTHTGTGAFCWLIPQGLQTTTDYRATIMGPGVTPDVMWTGAAPAAPAGYGAGGSATVQAAGCS